MMDAAKMGYVCNSAFLLWCFICFLPPVQSIKCFSCHGTLGTSCDNTTTEIECPLSAQRVYDSCYTVTKISDYVLIGRRVEQIKNCSVLADCGFLELLLCDDRDGFMNSCSIECCTGNLCNNKTFQLPRSSATRVMNFTSTSTHESFNRVVTSHVTQTRMPELTSWVHMTSSSSITRIYKTTNTSMSTSWTSAKSQVGIVSSAHAQLFPKAVTVEVKAVCANANRVFIPLHFVILLVFLASGLIIYERL